MTEHNRILHSEECLLEGSEWLARKEPRFAYALEKAGPVPMRERGDGFRALFDAIVSQQLSVAAAATIWSRLDTAGFCTPSAIVAADEDALRACGLSRQKIRYAKALAAANIDFEQLRQAPNEEIVSTLIEVPGIGRWTAEIYTMFSLRRADIFAPGDLALQESTRVLFELEKRPTERQLRARAEEWSPWRAVAARLLWSYYHIAKQREGIR
jgi:DNA-3-methyladenine glycosylase II